MIYPVSYSHPRIPCSVLTAHCWMHGIMRTKWRCENLINKIHTSALLECLLKHTAEVRANLEPEPVKLVLIIGIEPDPAVSPVDRTRASNFNPVSKSAPYTMKFTITTANVHREAEPIRGHAVQHIVVLDRESKRRTATATRHAPDSFEGRGVGGGEDTRHVCGVNDSFTDAYI